jgi:nucleoside-triphosphatase
LYNAIVFLPLFNEEEKNLILWNIPYKYGSDNMVEIFTSLNKVIKKVILTGPPGCGKTTVIIKALNEIKHEKVGFITREIRKGIKRMGFMIETISGEKALLAHREFKSPHRIGPYGVFIENIESLALKSINCGNPSSVIVIDEIGKMECLSSRFREEITRIIDSDRMILATIPVRGDQFIDSIRKRDDVLVIEINRGNRDELPKKLASLFNNIKV